VMTEFEVILGGYGAVAASATAGAFLTRPEKSPRGASGP
jgi:hypothetical protein